MVNLNSQRYLIPLFLLSAAFAFYAPLIFTSTIVAGKHGGFPGWPSHYQNIALKSLPLTRREQYFAQGFPGNIGRFKAAEKELIIRWVQSPTRKLHSAQDCFTGLGYTVTPLTTAATSPAVNMACFGARKNGHQELKVCETIVDNNGNAWSDVSSWYWQAVFNPASNGWWSYVIAQPMVDQTGAAFEKK